MASAEPKSTRPKFARSEWLALGVLAALSSVLFLTNLGNHHLWQDEAQTALLAQTVLSDGIPLGHDGRNSFSQENGAEFGESRVWKWHTWLSFYVCAASLALFGNDAFAARLPFALFGIATVLLTWFAGRSLWRDPKAAFLSAGFLALSVPFLILGRQCRYYTLASFFTLLAVLAYTRLADRGRLWAVTLFAAATLLFHTHYVYAGTLLAVLILHAATFDRKRLRTVLGISAGVALVNGPWIVWFSTIRYGERYADRVLDPALSAEVAARLVGLMVDHLFSPVFVAVAVVLAVAPLVGRGSAARPSSEVRRNLWLLVLLCTVTVAALALAAPSAYFRYLAPLAPLAFLVAGALVSALYRRSKLLAAAAGVAWLATGNLASFAYELTHDFDGPIEGIVETLDRYGDSDEIVATNYGDLPIKFYTGMRVVGGLTGEDLAPAKDAAWIILRKDRVGAEYDDRIREFLRPMLRSGDFARRSIDFPDTPFQNREDPTLHRFRTAPKDVPRIQIYHRNPRR